MKMRRICATPHLGEELLEKLGILEKTPEKEVETPRKKENQLLHRRRKKSSTIFCSQYGFEEWYDQLGGDASPLADAIIDRIAHDSYRVNITSIGSSFRCGVKYLESTEK